jgi:hypothetical protein
MRISLIYCMLIFFGEMQSQTFIGKTKEEILTIQMENSNKMSDKATDDTLGYHIAFNDSQRLLTHVFLFNKKDICYGYSIWTSDKGLVEWIKKDVEKIAQEKISENSWVQKYNNKVYGWQLKQTGEYFYSFSTSQIKQ